MRSDTCASSHLGFFSKVTSVIGDVVAPTKTGITGSQTIGKVGNEPTVYPGCLKQKVNGGEHPRNAGSNPSLCAGKL